MGSYNLGPSGSGIHPRRPVDVPGVALASVLTDQLVHFLEV
jgi:hypothetical protein